MRKSCVSLLTILCAVYFAPARAEDDTMQSLFAQQKVQTAAVSQTSNNPKILRQEERAITSIYSEPESTYPTYAVIGGDTGRGSYGGTAGYAPEISMDPKFARQEVDFHTQEPVGTVIINTDERMLYLVLGNGKAMRYGVGVGRPGFEWAGVKTVTRKAEWPDWRPPAEMLERRPDLPRFMPGGPENPLGARAMYLGSTLYRIHGTNEDNTIGGAVSSGCIRMRNSDVEDLYTRVKVGTKVVVL